MIRDKKQPKIYDEKCDKQKLILLTKTQNEKLRKLSERLGIKEAQIIRNHLVELFEKHNI